MKEYVILKFTNELVQQKTELKQLGPCLDGGKMKEIEGKKC